MEREHSRQWPQELRPVTQDTEDVETRPFS